MAAYRHQNDDGRALLAGGGGGEISGTANTSLSLSLWYQSRTCPCLALAVAGVIVENDTSSSPHAGVCGTCGAHAPPRFSGRPPPTTSNRSASRNGTCSSRPFCFYQRANDSVFSFTHAITSKKINVLTMP